MHLQPVVALTIILLFLSRAQLLFSDKESGSSETDSEQGNLKEDTDSKKRKRRKQKKIGEDLWINTEREEVECLPKEINGINVYIVNRKDEKDVKESLEDGRKWRKDCLTNWKGCEKVRYADCRGSYKCNNSACPFLEEYGIRNTRQWKKRAGKVFCQGCGDTGIYVPCNARRYLCHEKRRVLVFHCGFHTCPVSNHVTKDKEDFENIIKENPNIKPSEMQSARVLSAFRRGEDWQSVRKKVESTMDKQWLSNIKKKIKRDMEPVGHDYEAIITFKQYCDKNDIFYVYKINDNRGNPDKPSFVFKMGAEKARMAINMDRDGDHYLRDEFCFFDGKRKRCRGFVTLTASAYHPLLRKQVPLAIMEATAEDTPNIKLFWTLFNEVLQKIKRDNKYKFRPIGWCSDMAGANMAAICDVFGSEATRYIKTCEFHFKDNRNQKARKLDKDSSECFKLLCNDLLLSETVDGYNLAKTKIDTFVEECDGRAFLKSWISWWHDRRGFIFRAFSTKNAPQMNQAEVVHASWTHRDPPNMSLLDVCMADVRDTVVFEMELEGIKNGTCKAGTRGPSYAELQRRRHDREVQKAKRTAKEMFKTTDGRLIDPKSSYQPKNRKNSTTKKASQMQSQPDLHQSTQNRRPSDPAALQTCVEFGPRSSSVPYPPTSHNTHQTVLQPSGTQNTYPTGSQSTVAQDPYPNIQQMPVVFGPQPSPGPCPPKNSPQHQPTLSTNFHQLTGPTFVTPHAAVSTANSCPTVATQWQPWMSPHAYEFVILPNIVQKCYGCGSNFVDKYRYSPHNLAIKHIDRRIAGKDSLGQLRYSVDFNNTYYHPFMAHIKKKNPFFDGNVRISRSLYNTLDHGQHQVLASFDLKINIT